MAKKYGDPDKMTGRQRAAVANAVEAHKALQACSALATRYLKRRNRNLRSAVESGLTIAQVSRLAGVERSAVTRAMRENT